MNNHITLTNPAVFEAGAEDTFVISNYCYWLNPTQEKLINIKNKEYTKRGKVGRHLRTFTKKCQRLTYMDDVDWI